MIKNIFKGMTPPFLLLLYKKVYSVIFKQDKQNIAKEDISELYSKLLIKPYEDCLIIGNGPSLYDTLNGSKAIFKNKHIFCVNRFAQSKEYELYKPQYYVVADPNFYNKKSIKFKNKNILATVNSIKNKTTWKMKIFLPLKGKSWNYFQELPHQNENIELFYYNTSGNNNISDSQFKLYKNNEQSPIFQNVLIASLFLSLNLGFKKIYLIGADTSFHEEIRVNEDNILCKVAKHFYDSEASVQLKPFYKTFSREETFSMKEIFLSFSRVFEGYEIIEAYSKFLGSKIFNASYRSYIDAFERIKL